MAGVYWSQDLILCNGAKMDGTGSQILFHATTQRGALTCLVILILRNGAKMSGGLLHRRFCFTQWRNDATGCFYLFGDFDLRNSTKMSGSLLLRRFLFDATALRRNGERLPVW